MLFPYTLIQSLIIEDLATKANSRWLFIQSMAK